MVETKEEDLSCNVCDRPASHSCWCRFIECEICGEINHRYNMKSPREEESDFHMRDAEYQDDKCRCLECFYVIETDSSVKSESEDSYNSDSNSDSNNSDSDY